MTAGSGTAIYKDMKRMIKRNLARGVIVTFCLNAVGWACYGLYIAKVSGVHRESVWPFPAQNHFLIEFLELIADVAVIIAAFFLVVELVIFLFEAAEWD